jgi:hypothetical protein
VLRPKRIDERAASGIATDRGDERRARTETGQPTGGVRRRAALTKGDAPGNVRSAFERSRRHDDDIEHEVAKNDHPGRVSAATGDARARHAGRIALPQGADR